MAMDRNPFWCPNLICTLIWCPIDDLSEPSLHLSPAKALCSVFSKRATSYNRVPLLEYHPWSGAFLTEWVLA